MMFTARMFCKVLALTTVLAPSLYASTATAQQVITPRAGTIERTQILDAIRPAPDSKIRFVVHNLRVIKGKVATFAYASVEPSRQEYDGGEYILQRDSAKSAAPWRVIWAVTGGGANACADIAAYYNSATQHLAKSGIAVDALKPGHTSEAKRHATLATADEDCWSVGDLGPDIAVTDK